MSIQCYTCATRITLCTCYAQTMDVNNAWIACSMHRLRKMKDTEHGFGYSDTDACRTAGCLSEQELQA